MEEKIVAYIHELAAENGVKVDQDTDLYATGVFDSLKIFNFLSYLQEELGLDFSPEDLDFENYQTISAVLTWVKKQ